MTKKEYEAQIFEPIKPKIKYLLRKVKSRATKPRFYAYIRTPRVDNEWTNYQGTGFDCDIAAGNENEALKHLLAMFAD